MKLQFAFFTGESFKVILLQWGSLHMCRETNLALFRVLVIRMMESIHHGCYFVFIYELDFYHHL